MTETWRPVIGFEGIYSVSSLGRVRRDAAAQGTTSGRILTLISDRKGYAIVNLQVSGKRVRSKVHRLVAAAFYGPADGMQVRHLDNDRWNNRLANLRWGTAQENSDDRVASGNAINHNSVKTHCKRGHQFSIANTYVRVGKSGDKHRRCRTCHADAQRAKRQELAALTDRASSRAA